MSNPKQATLWTILEFVLGRGLNIVFIAVLARLLTPQDFGTFALLAIFLGVSTALIESGFGLALIQKQDITDGDISTVFWISLGAATVIALVLVVAAPVIAAFFDLEVLVHLTYIMAMTVWISGFGIVQRALLVKRLAFRQLTVVNLSALLISSSVSIYMAMSGLGVFTLAWQGFVSALIISAMLWVINGWRPKMSFSKSSAKHLFRFGGYMLASRLLDVIYTNSYTIMIGKSSGTTELGYFNRAQSATQIVAGLVVYPISQVAFPSFSQMNGDRTLIRSGLQSAVRISMFFNTVGMLTLASIAQPFVLTLLGPQWGYAAPILQVLSLASILMPMHVLNLQALMAMGRSELFLVQETIKKFVGVAILLFASHYGTMGIAWGLVGAGILAFFINTWYSGKYFNYGPVHQLRQIMPALVFGLIVSTTSHLAIRTIDTQSPFILLCIGVGTAVASLLAILCFTWWLGLDPTGLRSLLEREKNAMR